MIKGVCLSNWTLLPVFSSFVLCQLETVSQYGHQVKHYEFSKIWILNEQLPSDDSMSDYGSGSESDISELSYDDDDYEDYVLWNEEDKMLRKDPYKYDLVHTYQNVFLRSKFVF